MKLKTTLAPLTLIVLSSLANANTAKNLTYPIVDTNQTSCFSTTDKLSTCPKKDEATYGQDSQYQGIKASYTDNKDGTITDNNTGLMWQKTTDTNGDGKITVADKMTYDQAQAYAKKLTLAGHSDWRVPSIKELYSLMMFDGQDPSAVGGKKGDVTLIPFIDSEVFDYNAGDTKNHERLIDGQYISSTKYVGTTMQTHSETIFGVNFTDGRIKGYENKDPHGKADGKTFYVQLVRGNTEYGKNNFVDNKNDTVTDKATGLTWQQGDSQKGMDFPNALQYCENLTLNGNSNWRLPNVKELQSLADYTRSPETTNSAAISPIFKVSVIKNEAGNNDYPNYWSGTTHQSSAETNAGTMGAYVAFGRSMGNMNGWVDVHGAGAQRSDPKVGDASQFKDGSGPQGDAVRINNYVKCVTGGEATFVQQPTKITRKGVTFTLTGNEADASGKAPAMPENGQQKMGDPLKMMDKDGDNQLSKSEVKGMLANDFSKLDTNSDGYLSKTELDNAPKPQ